MSLPSEALPTENIALIAPAGFGPRQFRSVVVISSAVAGTFLIVFALGWLPGVQNASGAVGEVVSFLAAAYFFAMGIFGWILFGRVTSQRATELMVSSYGLKGIRGDGTAFDTSWSDPTLSGQITDAFADRTGAVGFRWQAGGRKAWARVSRAGVVALELTARQNGLQVETKTMGKPPRTWTVTQIRPKRAP
jgi:hypothetical protein